MMKTMKRILSGLFFVMLLSFNHTAIAQMRGGGRMGQGRSGHGNVHSQQKMRINVRKMAALHLYDEHKVLKKLRIKNKEQARKISALLQDYNRAVRNIELKYHDRIREAKRMAKEAGSNSYQAGNDTGMQLVRKQIRLKLAPVRKEVMVHQQELNRKMKQLLNKKQYKKWLKYQRKKNRIRSQNQTQMHNRNKRSGHGSRRGGGIRGGGGRGMYR